MFKSQGYGEEAIAGRHREDCRCTGDDSLPGLKIKKLWHINFGKRTLKFEH
jgi:hypothetical protein